jgi:hypothetical protein
MTEIDEALRYAALSNNGYYDEDSDEFYDADRIRAEFFEPDGRPRLNGSLTGSD